MRWTMIGEPFDRDGVEYCKCKSPFGYEMEQPYEDMKLLLAAPDVTAENYYSNETNEAYISVSQFKDFCGRNRNDVGCEAMGLAKLRGKFETPVTTPLLVGSYVDAYFEGTLQTFVAQHPEIYSSRGKTAGELKSDYKQASTMIDRAERDPLFMQFMAGNKQVIMTGQIAGIPVKIKIDSEDGKRITDLKTVKSIHETFFVKDSGERVPFVDYWKYDLQGGVYVEIYRQNTGLTLPFFIAAISKDKTDTIPHPRIAVIEVPPMVMRDRLQEFANGVPHIQALKKGEIEPIPCGMCDYCADTLPLDHIVSTDQLMAEF